MKAPNGWVPLLFEALALSQCLVLPFDATIRCTALTLFGGPQAVAARARVGRFQACGGRWFVIRTPRLCTFSCRQLVLIDVLYRWRGCVSKEGKGWLGYTVACSVLADLSSDA